jgi:hypothetical protein
MLPFPLGLPGFHVIYFWFVGVHGFRVISGLPFHFVLLFWVCMIFFLGFGTFLPLLHLAGACYFPSTYLSHLFLAGSCFSISIIVFALTYFYLQLWLLYFKLREIRFRSVLG